jgi:hypothetical protein
VVRIHSPRPTFSIPCAIRSARAKLMYGIVYEGSETTPSINVLRTLYWSEICPRFG